MLRPLPPSSWRNLRHELGRLAHTLAIVDGQVAQRSTLTERYKTILTALNLPESPRYFDFTTSEQDRVGTNLVRVV